jgi:DNA-binding transcriptional regulator GbsR (MarR family)
MSEVMREVLDSLAKMGKQWDLGESVGRVWGFLLFKSCPVTQREIEEGTGYSRGLISRCLKVLKRGPMIEVKREGREIRYSVNTSLTDSFGELLKRFLADNIKPMIELLSTSQDKIGDAKVKETFHALINEYKKLNLAVLLFSKIIDNINTMPVGVENVEEVAEKISMKIMI